VQAAAQELLREDELLRVAVLPESLSPALLHPRAAPEHVRPVSAHRKTKTRLSRR